MLYMNHELAELDKQSERRFYYSESFGSFVVTFKRVHYYFITIVNSKAAKF